MSHVDEGALHAYLDGALDEYPAADARRVREHLATCALCAERLADERRVREDARTILDLAAPKVEVPTFEELRAYVRAGHAQRRALGRLHRMGWAASVVLALGTGWFLRGGRIDPTRTFQAESDAPSASARTVTEEPGIAAEEGRTAATQRAPAPAPAESPAPADRDVTADAREVRTDAPASPRLAAEPPPAVARERSAANAPAVGGAGGRAEVAQATPAVQGAAPAQGQASAPAAAPPPQEPVPVTGAGTDVRALADARAAPGAVAGAVAGFDAQADAARVQQRLDSAARAAEARRRNGVDPSDQVVTSSLDVAVSAPLQRTVADDQAEREKSSGSLVVPGLPVLDVLPVSEGTAFAGVRALQRLESGDTLEVFHLPEGVDPSLLAPPAPETSQLVRQTPEGWLVLRAPLTMLDLERLLERLQPER